MELRLRLAPRRVALTLGAAAVLLAALSLLAGYIALQDPAGGPARGLARGLRLLNVNVEESIPSWYSALVHFCAAALAAAIAFAPRANQGTPRAPWAGISLALLYLSLNATTGIHKVILRASGDLLSSNRGLVYVCLAGIGLILLLVAVVYIRFWRTLPRPARRHFALAAAVYGGGAIVMESVSTYVYRLDGGASLRYLAISAVEEGGEMLGAVLIIYALLCYLSQDDAPAPPPT